MRFQDLEVGDYFIAMPLPEDLMPGRKVSMNVFRKISDIKLSGPIDSHVHDSGTAIRVATVQQSEFPQEMPVLRVNL